MIIDQRQRRPVLPAALCAITALFFFSGCSLPRIIILKDPLSAEEHVRLGSIYQNQGKLDLAEQQYREAVHKDSKSVQALRLLADLSFTVKKYSEAESAYKKALTLQPQDGDLSNNLCWVYLEQNVHIGRAAELIEKAIAATPGHLPYYLDTKGMILLKQGKVGEAAAVLTRALELLSPDQAGFQKEVYKHLAEVYRAAGETANAAAAEEQAARLQSGN